MVKHWSKRRGFNSTLWNQEIKTVRGAGSDQHRTQRLESKRKCPDRISIAGLISICINNTTSQPSTISRFFFGGLMRDRRSRVAGRWVCPVVLVLLPSPISHPVHTDNPRSHLGSPAICTPQGGRIVTVSGTTTPFLFQLCHLLEAPPSYQPTNADSWRMAIAT